MLKQTLDELLEGINRPLRKDEQWAVDKFIALAVEAADGRLRDAEMTVVELKVKIDRLSMQMVAASYEQAVSEMAGGDA